MAPAFSALGLLLSDHLVDEMRAYIAPVGEVDLDARQRAVRRDGSGGARACSASAAAQHTPRRGAPLRCNLCYPGQTFDMAVPVASAQRPAHASASSPHGRALPRPARGAAHLRVARRAADPARRAPDPGRRHREAAASDASAARHRKPPLKGRRQAYFGGRFVDARRSTTARACASASASRPGDHRGAVHDHRPAPAPARHARPLRQLPHRDRIVGPGTSLDRTIISHRGDAQSRGRTRRRQLPRNPITYGGKTGAHLGQHISAPPRLRAERDLLARLLQRRGRSSCAPVDVAQVGDAVSDLGYALGKISTCFGPLDRGSSPIRGISSPPYFPRQSEGTRT